MQPLRTLLLSTVLLALFACSKSSNSTNQYAITGVVTDTPFHNPVAGALMTLQIGDNSGSFVASTVTTTTDASGRYAFQVSGAPSDALFSLSAQKQGYLGYNALPIQVYNLRIASPNAADPLVRDVTLFREATLQVHLTASGLTNGATVFYGSHYNPDPNNFFQLVSMFRATPSVDTTLSFKTAGDVRTFVSISSDLRSYRDTVVVPAGTTRLIQASL